MLVARNSIPRIEMQSVMNSPKLDELSLLVKNKLDQPTSKRNVVLENTEKEKIPDQNTREVIFKVR